MTGLGLCLLAAGAAAQAITLSDVSYSYTATFTVTHWDTFTTTTCPCTSTSSKPLVPDDPALTYSTPTTTVLTSSGTPSTTTSLTPLIPDGTITPSFTSTSDTGAPSSSTGPGGGIPTLSTSTTAAGSEPSVTNSAYINAILRHHNIHRTNHSANALAWSSSLAETARVIAQTCVYAHRTDVGGGGYGQNIGAGYSGSPLSMGQFVTEGLYNSEVNKYTAYGSEPNLADFGMWGHFTQVVWKNTDSVGCYTADCTNSGLANAPGIPPFFTVCNYAPPGNFAGFFNVNIGTSIGLATVYGDY